MQGFLEYIQTYISEKIECDVLTNPVIRAIADPKASDSTLWCVKNCEIHVQISATPSFFVFGV